MARGADSAQQDRFARSTPSPLLDFAQFAMPAPTPATKEAYLQVLADGLDLVDAIKDISKALHDQAKRALEAGDSRAAAMRFQPAAPSGIGMTKTLPSAR